MTKKATIGSEDAFYDDVRAHVTAFRRTNGGADPTRAQVAASMKRRKTDICRVMAQIERDEITEAGRLGMLPEIPTDVTDAGAKLVDRIWVAAHETASLALSEMRARIADMQTRQRRQLGEVEELFEQTETELDTAIARAEAAEAQLAEVQAENVRLASELSRAEAKLEDREAFVAMMSGALVTKPERAPKQVKRTAADPAGHLEAAGQPDTADLPMMPSQQ